jgi:hypothetical protein
MQIYSSTWYRCDTIHEGVGCGEYRGKLSAVIIIVVGGWG